MSSINEVRKYLLEELRDLRSSGVKWVRWSSPRDDCTCNKCLDREGKRFSLKEMREIVKGDFCDGDDFDNDEARARGERLPVCRCDLRAVLRDYDDEPTSKKSHKNTEDGCLLILIAPLLFLLRWL